MAFESSLKHYCTWQDTAAFSATVALPFKTPFYKSYFGKVNATAAQVIEFEVIKECLQGKDVQEEDTEGVWLVTQRAFGVFKDPSCLKLTLGCGNMLQFFNGKLYNAWNKELRKTSLWAAYELHMCKPC